MGMSMILSSSSFDKESITKACNPNPMNYKIKSANHFGNFLILLINYPECRNYEGDKILVYKDCTLDDLKEQECIDPHFSNNLDFHSPIARFNPDEDGMVNAITFVKSIGGLND